jgi:hypothetical protein
MRNHCALIVFLALPVLEQMNRWSGADDFSVKTNLPPKISRLLTIPKGYSVSRFIRLRRTKSRYGVFVPTIGIKKHTAR